MLLPVDLPRGLEVPNIVVLLYISPRRLASAPSNMTGGDHDRLFTLWRSREVDLHLSTFCVGSYHFLKEVRHR